MARPGRRAGRMPSRCPDQSHDHGIGHARADTGKRVCGRSAGCAGGSDPEEPFIRIVWWVNQELLHHGAEIVLLRDLDRARPR